MEDGFTLKRSTVGIIGLGLMGGSMALALKGHCARLVGFDSHLPTLELALSKNIVDEADVDPAYLLREVDLLILATPVTTILNLLQQLPALLPNPCVLMDLGSTKREIVHAMSALPQHIHSLGGHPICGKEKLGLGNAEATLYQGAPFVVTPSEGTTFRARSAAEQVIAAIGAHLMEMTAEAHDRVLASTSHLPFLIASSLARSIPHEYEALIGPGFRSTSRLAGTPSHMMMGILESNRDNILNAVQAYRKSLSEVESALQNENYAELENLLDQAHMSYHPMTAS